MQNLNTTTIHQPATHGSRLGRHLTRLRRQRGFTLLELLVVLGLMGVILASSKDQIINAFRLADYAHLYKIADTGAANWRLATNRCGASDQIGSATNSLTTTTTAAGNQQWLVDGTGVAAAYAGCVAGLNLNPLNAAGVRGTTGSYTVEGYAYTIANVVINGQNRVATTFAGVTDQTVLSLIRDNGGQATAKSMQATDAVFTSGDTTDNNIQYGAGTTGSRTVTIIR